MFAYGRTARKRDVRRSNAPGPDHGAQPLDVRRSATAPRGPARRPASRPATASSRGGSGRSRSARACRTASSSLATISSQLSRIRASCSAARNVNAWKSSCPAEPSTGWTLAGLASSRFSAAYPIAALCRKTRPVWRPGVRGELVGQAGEAVVEQPVQPLLRQVADLGEGELERVELQAERLGVEVAARVQAGGLVAVGVEEQRAVGDGAQLARDLRVDVRRAGRAPRRGPAGARGGRPAAAGGRTSPPRPACSATSAAWIRACPGSPLSAPMRVEYGRSDAPVSAAVGAPASVAWSSSARARARRADAVSAGASGAPLTSAIPSLTPGS